MLAAQGTKQYSAGNGKVATRKKSARTPRSPPSPARMLVEASMLSALETLTEIQRLHDDAEELEPEYAERYRRFLSAAADYYLLYLSSLSHLAAREGGFGT